MVVFHNNNEKKVFLLSCGCITDYDLNYFNMKATKEVNYN